MPAKALEELRARSERTVEVERRNRATRSLPPSVGAGNQHDRPVVALDEPRGDDADHSLVPVLSPEDVRTAPLLRIRPFVDLFDRRAQDAILDGLPVAVQLLEALGERPRLRCVLRQEQVERRARMAEPACCVDARRETEADVARVPPPGG